VRRKKAASPSHAPALPRSYNLGAIAPNPIQAKAKSLSKAKAMNLPWWVFRIWAKGNGTPLNTYGYGTKGRRPGEYERLESLICETIHVMPEPASRREAERIVAYAWALYVFSDPAVYNEKTKFPLSSFIELSQGYIVAAFDGIRWVEHARGYAERAFREAMG
jgi:hypothetical protein